MDRLVEVEKDLFKALELEEDRRKGINIPPNIYCPSYLNYSRCMNYKDQIDRYLKFFPLKQIRIFFLKEIAEDERAVLEEILSFIGVDDTQFYSEKGVFRNKRKTVRFKKLWTILKHSRLWTFVKKKSPPKVLGFLDSMIFKILFKPIEKKGLTIEKKNRLMKRWKGQVKDLDKYLNEKGLIDFNLLEFWGYEEKIVEKL